MKLNLFNEEIHFLLAINERKKEREKNIKDFHFLYYYSANIKLKTRIVYQ